MKVRVLQTAYLDNTIRYAGEVFEWSYTGDKLPGCVEPVEQAPTGDTKHKPQTGKRQ